MENPRLAKFGLIAAAVVALAAPALIGLGVLIAAVAVGLSG